MRDRDLPRARRCAAIITTIAVLAATGCTDAGPRQAGIGSGDISGSYSATATALARVANTAGGASDVRFVDVPTSGSIANVEGVLSGELAFGLAQADVEHDALHGHGHWAEKGPQGDLRSVLSLYTEAVTIVATRDSGIRTTSDLIGRRIDIGHVTSGAQRNATDVLDALPGEWREGTTVYEQTTDERSRMYLRGDLDAFFTTVGHPTSDILFAVNSGPGARLVAIDHGSELLDRHPFYVPTTISASIYPGLANKANVTTIGVKTILVTSASTPEATVYALTRAAFDDIGALVRYDPVLRSLSRARMMRGMSAPLHPGAERYFRETGLIPAEGE